MANVAHSTLTGSDLHEPKGISSAVLGTVYVANGSGSGSWADVGTASFTGMIADFVTPVAPSGWLELDGTVISTTTFSGLYAVMVIQTTGTRTNGSPIITSIATTAKFANGYFVFGTGIPTGTTIISIDSANQITLSNNATSSGTSAFAVSPWLLNTGTIKLPDTTAAGRFRRSRSSTTAIGQTQADQNQAHTHTTSGTTNDPGNHTHVNTLTDTGHTHTTNAGNGLLVLNAGGNERGVSPGSGYISNIVSTSSTTGIVINNAAAGAHTHTTTGTAASQGGTEARPLGLVVLTCVKT